MLYLICFLFIYDSIVSGVSGSGAPEEFARAARTPYGVLEQNEQESENIWEIKILITEKLP